MYKLVISSKFKRSLRKFARRHVNLQGKIEKTLLAMENDVFAANLGKYVDKYRQGTNLVLLDPDIAKAFPTDESVNEALRLLIWKNNDKD